MTSDPILTLLACPRCSSALSGSLSSLRCPACELEFPAVGGIPWLYRDPLAKVGEWRGQVDFAMGDMARTEDRLKVAGREPALGPLAKRRLQKELQARVEHRKALLALLAPLVGADPGKIDLLRILGGKAAGTQTLASYAVNAIRDWGWPDTDENRLALELTRSVLKSDAPFSRALVLGAGAGRLAYDLHQAVVADLTLTLDINPFLTFVAQRMYAGKSLALSEFPLAPDGLDHVAVTRRLGAPAKARAGLHCVFGDVLDAPLAAGAFDLVVTPWLIDILPEGPRAFLARLNRLLKPGGVWLNHGSCAFQQGRPEQQVSREELLEIVVETGFANPETRLDRVPYLSSPASCQARSELVLTFAATKLRDVPVPPPYAPLPVFLADRTRPMPRPERLVQLHATHAFHAEVLNLVDGQRSLQDVCALLGQKYRVPPAELAGSLTAFFLTMYGNEVSPPSA